MSALSHRNSMRLYAIKNSDDFREWQWQRIPDKLTRLHFGLHLSRLAVLSRAPFPPAPIDRYASIAGLLLLAASAISQWLNLKRAQRLFLEHGGHLD